MTAIRKINILSENISDDYIMWLAYCGLDAGMELDDFLGLIFGTYGLDSSVACAISRLIELSGIEIIEADKL